MNGTNRPKRLLMRSLAAGESDLYQIAAAHKMSLLEMAKWARRPRVMDVLAMLQRFSEQRASLMLADARAQAVESLRRMATADAPKETARRACIDLLKLQLVRGAVVGQERSEAESGADEAAVAELNRAMEAYDTVTPAMEQAEP